MSRTDSGSGPTGRRVPRWMAPALAGVVVLVLAAGGCLWYLHLPPFGRTVAGAGAGMHAEGGGATHPAAAGETLYQCPMHPSVISTEPGNCPICGMRMVPVEAHETPTPEGGEAGTPARPAVEGYVPVRVPGARQQLIGVRTTPVEVRTLTKHIRTVGVVQEDETRVHHVHTKVPGWIERLQVDFVGQRVRRGEALYEIYSPDIVATEEEFLLALRSRSRMQGSSFPEVSEGADRLLDASRRRLRLWDVPEDKIRQLEAGGDVTRTVTFYAPISGYVTKKWVEHGMYVDPGKMLFTITDLSEVWVQADVYEYELPLVKEGQEATLTTAAYPSEVFKGRADYVYPTLDATTRTAKVRFQFPNPGLRLKPEMYANVDIEVPLGSRLAAPEEAILDTGTRQLAFVDLGDGWFEPRDVHTGVKAEGWVEVLHGLKPGERVVTDGNFMLDSESRLKASVAMAAPGAGEGGGASHAGHAGH